MTIGTLKNQTGKQKMPRPLSRNFEASIPADLYAETKIHEGCVRLFCIIKQLHDDKTKFCTASNKTLGYYAGIAPRTIQKYLKLLREAGFLSVKLEVKDGNFYRFLHVSNDRIDTCREIVRNFDDKQNTRRVEDFENNEDADCKEQDEARDADTGEEVVPFEAQKSVRQGGLIPPQQPTRATTVVKKVETVDAMPSKKPAMPSYDDDAVDFNATYQEGTKPFHWAVPVFLRLKDRKPSESAFNQWCDCEDWRYVSNTYKRTVKQLYAEGWRYDDRFFKPVPPDIDETMIKALLENAEAIGSPENARRLIDPLYDIITGENRAWDDAEAKKPEEERKPFPYNKDNYFTFPFAQWIKDHAEELVKKKWRDLSMRLLRMAKCYVWSYRENEIAGILEDYFPKPYVWC